MNVSMLDFHNIEVFEGGQAEPASKWTASALYNVPQTSSMITTAKSDHKDFRFIMSPSPGSRSLDIMSY